MLSWRAETWLCLFLCRAVQGSTKTPSLQSLESSPFWLLITPASHYCLSTKRGSSVAGGRGSPIPAFSSQPSQEGPVMRGASHCLFSWMGCSKPQCVYSLILSGNYEPDHVTLLHILFHYCSDSCPGLSITNRRSPKDLPEDQSLTPTLTSGLSKPLVTPTPGDPSPSSGPAHTCLELLHWQQCPVLSRRCVQT